MRYSLVLLMLFSTVLAGGQTCELPTTPQKKLLGDCVRVEGTSVRVCIEIRQLPGNDSRVVILTETLLNDGAKPVRPFWFSDFYDVYKMSVRDPVGNLVLSKREIADKEGNLQKQIELLPINSRFGPVTIPPGCQIRGQYSLHFMYDFILSGEYEFEMTTKLTLATREPDAKLIYRDEPHINVEFPIQKVLVN